MKYEVGKTYTLTGDEPHWSGPDQTIAETYTSISFPGSAEVVGIDEDGDVVFDVAGRSGGGVCIVHSSANTEPASEFDVVSKPEHYNTNLPGGVEVIDIIAAQTAGLSGMQAVAQANLIKYALRWQKKNGAEDLKKARAYIDRLITEVEGN